jgi:hypothetical protein
MKRQLAAGAVVLVLLLLSFSSGPAQQVQVLKTDDADPGQLETTVRIGGMAPGIVLGGGGGEGCCGVGWAQCGPAGVDVRVGEPENGIRAIQRMAGLLDSPILAGHLAIARIKDLAIEADQPDLGIAALMKIARETPHSVLKRSAMLAASEIYQEAGNTAAAIEMMVSLVKTAEHEERPVDRSVEREGMEFGRMLREHPELDAERREMLRQERGNLGEMKERMASEMQEVDLLRRRLRAECDELHERVRQLEGERNSLRADVERLRRISRERGAEGAERE